MKSIDPNVKIVFNEYQIESGDAGQCFLEYINGSRSKIDILGVQSHVKNPVANHVWDNLEVVAGKNKENRLLITEFDVQDLDVNERALDIEDFMRTAFSHPNVDAFIFWNWRRENKDDPDTHEALFEIGLTASPANPIIQPPSNCDAFNPLCNFNAMGPNAAGVKFLEMVKREWNTTSGNGHFDQLNVDRLEAWIYIYHLNICCK